MYQLAIDLILIAWYLNYGCQLEARVEALPFMFNSTGPDLALRLCYVDLLHTGHISSTFFPL